MELYYVISILDRDKRTRQEKIYKSLGLKISMIMMGRGTATNAHLSMYGLTLTEKAVVATIADRDTAALLFRQTKQKLYIDIPGNGIMVSIPIKSVGGAETLEQLTGGKTANSDKPDMNFEYELVYVILNEGHSDEVMDVARPAGAICFSLPVSQVAGLRRIEE